MGDVYTLLCLRSDELSKAFGLFQNISCDSSRVQDKMLESLENLIQIE